MKHRRQYIFMLLTGLCIPGWIRSHYHADTLIYRHDEQFVAVGLIPGSLAVVEFNSIEMLIDPVLSYHTPKWNPNRNTPSVQTNSLGFAGSRRGTNSGVDFTPHASPFVSEKWVAFNVTTRSVAGNTRVLISPNQSSPSTSSSEPSRDSTTKKLSHLDVSL